MRKYSRKNQKVKERAIKVIRAFLIISPFVHQGHINLKHIVKRKNIEHKTLISIRNTVKLNPILKIEV